MSVAETNATPLSLAPKVLWDTSMVGLGTTCQVPVTGVGLGLGLGSGVAVGVGWGFGRALAFALRVIWGHQLMPASSSRPRTSGSPIQVRRRIRCSSSIGNERSALDARSITLRVTSSHLRLNCYKAVTVGVNACGV